MSTREHSGRRGLRHLGKERARPARSRRAANPKNLAKTTKRGAYAPNRKQAFDFKYLEYTESPTISL